MTLSDLFTDSDHEIGCAIVRQWSESEGRGLALSIMIAKALSAARASAWVKCSERMPKLNTYKLIYTPGASPRDTLRTAYWDGAHWDAGNGPLIRQPTHWQELPPLPSEPKR